MNNLEKLTVEERADVVDRFFSINRSTVTIARMTNGVKHYGFFDSVDDADELSERHKFRFVPMNQAIAYRDARDRHIKKSHTIVIDCKDLVDLKMIHAHLSEEIEVDVPGLREYLSGKRQMTHREYLAQLHKESVEKMDVYVKAENELSKVNGFFDKALFDKTSQAKRAWQDAHNRYQNMLYHVNSNHINPDSILHL